MKRGLCITSLILLAGLAGPVRDLGAQAPPTIASLKSSVLALVPAKLSAANARLLTSLLDMAQLRITQGRNPAAAVLLNTFISTLNKFKSSTPPALNGADADALIAQANVVIAAIVGQPPVQLSGTAAKGAPIVNATITAKDRNGTVRTGTTDATGKFTLDVTGLTAPYLLKVTAPTVPTPTDYYSVGIASGIVNITPFTDLILRNDYAVRGLDVATVFNTLNSLSPVPTAAEIQILTTMVASVLAQWLAAQGIPAEGWNAITTPFDANGTGADAVLAESTVTITGPSTITVVVSSGTVTQNSIFTSDSGSSSVTADSTTTDSSSGASSQSQSSSIIPTVSALQLALQGVDATMTQFKNTVNTKGAALTAADLLPYLVPTGYFNEGKDAATETAEIAGDLRGNPFPTMTLKQVVSFDSVNQVITVDFNVIGAAGGDFVMTFKQVAGSWLWYGNQSFVQEHSVQVESRIDDFAVPVANRHVNVDIRPLQGTVPANGITITGGGVFLNSPVPWSGGTELVTLHPTPNPLNDYVITRDTFFTGANLLSYPPPGTPFTVTVTPVVGSPTVTTLLSGSTTDETIAASTIPGGHGIAGVLGQTVTVNWTLPTTFPITEVKLGGYAQNASLQEVNLSSLSTLTTTSTTGQVVIPAQVNGQPTTQSGININVRGAGGIQILYIYFFQ